MSGRSDSVQVEVTVTNTGTREGKEVVQLYTRQRVASVDPPVRRLRGFQKIALAPGASRTVTFTLPVADLSFVGRNGRPVLEPGTYEVMIGGLTASFEVSSR
jgi:beta-glucosidase